MSCRLIPRRHRIELDCVTCRLSTATRLGGIFLQTLCPLFEIRRNRTQLFGTKSRTCPLTLKAPDIGFSAYLMGRTNIPPTIDLRLRPTDLSLGDLLNGVDPFAGTRGSSITFGFKPSPLPGRQLR